MKTTPFAVAGRWRATPCRRPRRARRRLRSASSAVETPSGRQVRPQQLERVRRRPRGSSSGSRRASAPTASARAASASRRSARAAARAGAASPPEPGTSAARGDEPELPEQLAPRRAEAVAGARLRRAPRAPARSTRRPLREVARRRRTAAASRSATTASASSSPTPRTYAEPDADGAVLDRAAARRSRSRRAGAPRTPRRCRRGRGSPAGRSPSAARSGARTGTRPGSGGAATPTGRRAARTRRRATSGSRSRRSRRACRRPRRAVSLVDAVRERALDEARAVAPRAPRALRLRLIARRSPSASPTVKPASAIATSSTWSWKTTTPSVSRSGSREQRVVDRRDERRVLAQPLPALDVRVDGAALDRPRPDERDLDRSGRRGSRAACAAGSASARGSRSGSRRRCRPRWISRVDRPGRRAGCARGRSARRAARAIRSTQSSTAESIPSPSRSIFRKPASAHESLSHWQIWRPCHRRRLHRDELDERPRRDDHPARVLRDVARQAGDLARTARRTRASAASAACARVGERARAPRRRGARSSRR